VSATTTPTLAAVIRDARHPEPAIVFDHGWNACSTVSRRKRRQKFFAFDFKGKFPRFRIRSVSTAIDINRSNFDIRWLGRGERMVDLTITARDLVFSESSLSEPCPSIVPQGFKGVFKRHRNERRFSPVPP